MVYLRRPLRSDGTEPNRVGRGCVHRFAQRWGRIGPRRGLHQCPSVGPNGSGHGGGHHRAPIPGGLRDHRAGDLGLLEGEVRVRASLRIAHRDSRDVPSGVDLWCIWAFVTRGDAAAGHTDHARGDRGRARVAVVRPGVPADRLRGSRFAVARLVGDRVHRHRSRSLLGRVTQPATTRFAGAAGQSETSATMRAEASVAVPSARWIVTTTQSLADVIVTAPTPTWVMRTAKLMIDSVTIRISERNHIRAATSVANMKRPVSAATNRWTNSTKTAVSARSGTADPLHRGQSGHARPAPIPRTVPPTTIVAYAKTAPRIATT